MKTTLNTMKAIHWLTGHAARGKQACYCRFAIWHGQVCGGGAEALADTWKRLYDLGYVDTMHPSDSYIIPVSVKEG